MELAMMCGLPCSGKSTYVRGLMEDGWVRVCPDDIRLAIHGQQFNPDAEPLVWATAEYMVKALLISGHKVVVDATNTMKIRRKQWINVAKKFDIKPKIIYVPTTEEECLKRNEAIKRLDPSVIKRMSKQFEAPDELGVQIIILKQ